MSTASGPRSGRPHPGRTSSGATSSGRTSSGRTSSGRTHPGSRAAGGSASGADSRRALVFGGGGVLGFAWTLGALRALETEWGIDATAVGLTVGTSAGSMLAALLGCGIPVDVMRRHHQGVPAPADPIIEWDYANDSGGALPPWPGFVPGSPRLFLDAMLHPTSIVPAVAFSGLLPRGRGSLDPIRAVISTAVAATDNAGGESDWPARPRTWIVATDYDNGARVVFGRDQAASAPVSLGDAVAASCSIPAWYAPVRIGDRLYIDGGTVSNASADLVLSAVADGTIDEVFVLAPMASVEPDRPRSPMVRLERAIRRAVTRGIQHDADRLRAAGARVVVITPGPYDLDVMGANLMNPRRRTEVLETSLLTSAAALRELRLNEDITARRSEGAQAEAGVRTGGGTRAAGQASIGPESVCVPAGRSPHGHGVERVGAGGPGPERSTQ